MYVTVNKDDTLVKGDDVIDLVAFVHMLIGNGPLPLCCFLPVSKCVIYLPSTIGFQPNKSLTMLNLINQSGVRLLDRVVLKFKI